MIDTTIETGIGSAVADETWPLDPAGPQLDAQLRDSTPAR